MAKHVIGFTGAVGSGCTTAAKCLRDTEGFAYVSLADQLRAEWTARHGEQEPSRHDLQQLGNEIRQAEGAGALVRRLFKTIEETDEIAIASIRNLGELDELREAFGYRFTLFAILSDTAKRWDRIRPTYTDRGLTERDFLEDDRRDRNEDVPNGQQVQLCVDAADVFIHNATDHASFEDKLREYVGLVTGTRPRQARDDEIRMHMAYAASHSSKCLKRRVGAVVVSGSGGIVGAGYNENPRATLPCVLEPSYDYQCYKDRILRDHFVALRDIGTHCPRCGQVLAFEDGPPWKCKSCFTAGQNTRLEELFFPDRGSWWCTAIHAEVWAILNAGERCPGSTLYTTTFPCFQCAEKISQAGIVRVQYTEAYPDVKSEHRLKLASVELTRFEGIRSSAFQRIFSPLKGN